MTWTCDQVEAQLSDYLEGMLQAADRAAFEAHAQSCPECAPLLAGVRSVMTELQSMEEVEAPPRLVYSILDKTLGPARNRVGLAGIPPIPWWLSITEVRLWRCKRHGHVGHSCERFRNLSSQAEAG